MPQLCGLVVEAWTWDREVPGSNLPLGCEQVGDPRVLERPRASSESWVVCDTRYPSMEASLS